MSRHLICKCLPALIIAALISGCGGHATAELVNRSPSALADVEVRFTGGSAAAGALAPAEAKTVELKPTGDSHLEITYNSASGAQKCVLDTYFERGNTAQFKIELRDRSCNLKHAKVTL